jgi:CO/xanthine dehydrogenase FAD-binding subunit
MTILSPTSIDEAVAALADPAIQVLAGGTDFMVEVNAGHRRPDKVLSLRHIPELRTWEQLPARDGPARAARDDPAHVRLGATVTYTDMLQPDLAQLLPALAHAARTVGSPQIRNAGTIGGNLATASPAGDTLPVLAALEAVVEVASPLGVRDIPVATFITGPKRTALSPGELIVAVRLPLLDGHQEFRKIGVRNAMVIAVASLALAVDTRTRTVRCALGSVGPGPIRATEAEEWLAGTIDWDRPAATTEAPDLAYFGRLVAGAAQPIDDHRGTAAYRRHAIGVLAERAAAQAFGAGSAA